MDIKKKGLPRAGVVGNREVRAEANRDAADVQRSRARILQHHRFGCAGVVDRLVAEAQRGGRERDRCRGRHNLPARQRTRSSVVIGIARVRRSDCVRAHRQGRGRAGRRCRVTRHRTSRATRVRAPRYVAAEGHRLGARIPAALQQARVARQRGRERHRLPERRRIRAASQRYADARVRIRRRYRCRGARRLVVSIGCLRRGHRAGAARPQSSCRLNLHSSTPRHRWCR